MNIKSITTVAGATILLSTPVLSSAGVAPPGFDSCVKAFFASLPTKIGGTPTLRDSSYVDNASRMLPLTQLVMTARNSRDRRVVWEATCFLNSRGEVTELQDMMSRNQ